MRIVLPFVLILLSGCVAQPLKLFKSEPIVTRPPEETLQEARQLVAERQWVEAVNTLNSGLLTHPDNTQLQEMLQQVKERWQHHKRLLEDRILLSESRSIYEKLPLLEQLSESDPNNIAVKSRLLFWRKLQESKLHRLLNCGNYHFKSDIHLAEQCLITADTIDSTAMSREMLSKVRQILNEKQNVADRKQQVAKIAVAKKVKSRKTEQLLKSSRYHYENKNYKKAIDTLNQLVRLEPKHQEGTRLLDSALSKRNAQVVELLEMGDRLYREEQIEQAVSVWEAASKLDPGRKDIADRIDRALKVLNKLEKIRRGTG